jgi:hypothetical protein
MLQESYQWQRYSNVDSIMSDDDGLLISDVFFPQNVPPSKLHGAIAVPFNLPSPVTAEVNTSFSRSIDAILATQTEREVAEECALLSLNATSCI